MIVNPRLFNQEIHGSSVATDNHVFRSGGIQILYYIPFFCSNPAQVVQYGNTMYV
jgi:hypothetical protein